MEISLSMGVPYPITPLKYAPRLGSISWKTCN